MAIKPKKVKKNTNLILMFYKINLEILKERINLWKKAK